MNAQPLVRRAALPVVIALAAGLSLTGCGDVARANEAARIGDVVVTTDEVQTATRDLMAADPQGKPVPPADVARVLAYGRFAEPIAAKYGQGVTDAAVNARIPAARTLTPAAREALRLNSLLGQNLDAQNPRFREEFTKQLQDADVSFNPRYGTVDKGAKGGFPLVAGTIPWIKGADSADAQAPAQQ